MNARETIVTLFVTTHLIELLVYDRVRLSLIAFTLLPRMRNLTFDDKLTADNNTQLGRAPGIEFYDVF